MPRIQRMIRDACTTDVHVRRRRKRYGHNEEIDGRGRPSYGVLSVARPSFLDRSSVAVLGRSLPIAPAPLSVLILLLVLQAQAIAQPGPPDLPADPVTGVKLRQDLDRPLLGSWENVELRDLLRRVGVLRNLSVILDRRIDPTVQPEIQLTGAPLRQGFDQIARMTGGGASFPQSVVYIGPSAAARTLRTWIEVKTAELSSAGLQIPEKRQFQLLARHNWRWDDLETPGEILQQIAGTTDLEIRGVERIPHDLWAGAILPDTTTPEALALVLIQFELTWNWAEQGRAIEIVPIAAAPVVERRLKLPRGLSAEKAVERLRAELPDLAVEPTRGEVFARGFLEDLDEAPQVMTSPSGRRPVAVKGPEPVRNRKLTLRTVRTPIRAILGELEKTGVVFEYDADELREAGVDLGAEVTVEIRDADADAFFKVLFAGQGVRWEIEGLVVRLRGDEIGK